jgi:hypothetical protein
MLSPPTQEEATHGAKQKKIKKGYDMQARNSVFPKLCIICKKGICAKMTTKIRFSFF